jgi:LemA protein
LKAALIVIAGVIVLAAALGSGLLRRDLARERDAIAAQWTEVAAALQERAELAPRLVEAVKGDARIEPAAIVLVTESGEALLRARTPRDGIQANNRLDTALAGLLAAAGNLPRLAGNVSFPLVRDDLAAADYRVAEARRKYNEAVQRYNTDIELFPRNVVAWLAGLKRNDAYFRAE